MTNRNIDTQIDTPPLQISNQNNDELLTVKETCEILKCGQTRLYQFIKAGQLKSLQMGKSRRIPRSAINEFINTLRNT